MPWINLNHDLWKGIKNNLILYFVCIETQSFCNYTNYYSSYLCNFLEKIKNIPFYSLMQFYLTCDKMDKVKKFKNYKGA